MRLIFAWLLISFSLSIIFPVLFKWPLDFNLILGLFLSFWILVTTAALILKRYKNNNLLNRSFISMAIAHLGVAICVAGVSLTTHLEVEKDVAMKVGDKVQVGDYQFYLKNLKEVMGPNYQGVQAEMQIGDLKLYPEKRLYKPREMPISETAIFPGLFRDLYVALGEPLGEETWSVRIYVKPFVRWIWLGALLMALGGCCSIAKGK
jgi:cytochrome c-type biogenesis protein CcmF